MPRYIITTDNMGRERHRKPYYGLFGLIGRGWPVIALLFLIVVLISVLSGK